MTSDITHFSEVITASCNCADTRLTGYFIRTGIPLQPAENMIRASVNPVFQYVD